MSSTDERDPEPRRNLTYLFKHAHLRIAELTTKALAPYGIDGREFGVLLALVGHEPKSQQQAAGRLGIDRTTMVALLDTLEDKGLVARHPDVHDRRRNVVELTAAARDVLRQATRAVDAVEREFLAPLSQETARQLREALRAIVVPPDA